MERALIGSSLEAPTAEQREADLVARHRHGDPSAFEEFYRHFAGMVYNVTLRHSGRPEVAQDLSQEIFLKIYRSLGRFRGKSSLKTWTYRVCINHCRSRLGRRTLKTRSLAREGGEEIEVPDPARGPEDRAIALDEAARLAAELPRVDAPFREALVLCDLEGLSYREIAQVLEIPIGTVRSRIARGREQLRRLLENRE